MVDIIKEDKIKVDEFKIEKFKADAINSHSGGIWCILLKSKLQNGVFTAARALAAAVMSLFCHNNKKNKNNRKNKPLNFSSFFFSFFRILIFFFL